MSYGNNDNFDNLNPNTGAAGLDNTHQFGQRQSFDDQNIGNQSYGQGNTGQGNTNQGNIGHNQGSNWWSGDTDSGHFDRTGRIQYGSSAGRDTFGSSGSDRYGSNTGMGGIGSGVGSTGDSHGSDPRNQGIGYGSDQSSGIGQQQSHKPTMGDKMRGGLEKGIGKMTGQPELIEKGQERATGQFDSPRRNV